MKPLGSLPRPERGEAWDLSRLRAAVESRRRGELDEKTAAELLAWNLRLGAAPAVAESWRAVTRGEGVVVVTGQQPAMLGGPLYTLYKLLTADALAKEIEARMGRPALAVFWLVGDDSDFGEVASTWLPDAEARPVQLRDEESPPRGALIGRLSRERQRAVWDGASALRSAFPRAEDGAKLVADAFAVARDWSEWSAALFHRLVPGSNLLVIDGAHPALLDAARRFLLTALREWPLASLLARGEAEAREAGFEPALEAELGSRALFRIEGEVRRPLEPEEPAEAGVVAPNVVLRPLLQDWLLPNVATICGPAEVRYRAQLGPLYRHAALPEPLRPSRLHALLLPPGEAIENRWEVAASEPERLVEEEMAARVPAGPYAELESLREQTRRELGRLGASLAAFDPSLPQQSESATGKIDYQLQRLLDGLKAKARHRVGQKEPLLLGLKDWVRPREREQERVHSLLLPFLLEGPRAIEVLSRAATEEVALRLDQRLEAERSLVLALEAAPERRRS